MVAIAADVVTATVRELLMPRPSVKPTVSLGSTIGALKLPSLNRTKPRDTPLESMKTPTMSPLSLIFCGEGQISGPGIIKSRDHFDRARVRCLLSERPHQWEHE